MKLTQKLYLLGAAALTLSSFNASAEGDKAGNGGRAYVCYGPTNPTTHIPPVISAEAADYWVAKLQTTLKIDLGSPRAGMNLVDSYVYNVIERIGKFDSVRADFMKEHYETLKKEVVMLTEAQLVLINDATFNLKAKPQNCDLVQAAYFKTNPAPSEYKYVFNKDIFDKMSPVDQAGLFLHEVNYMFEVEYGATTSDGAMEINRQTSAASFDSWTREQYYEFSQKYAKHRGIKLDNGVFSEYTLAADGKNAVSGKIAKVSRYTQISGKIIDQPNTVLSLKAICDEGSRAVFNENGALSKCGDYTRYSSTENSFLGGSIRVGGFALPFYGSRGKWNLRADGRLENMGASMIDMIGVSNLGISISKYKVILNSDLSSIDRIYMNDPFALDAPKNSSVRVAPQSKNQISFKATGWISDLLIKYGSNNQLQSIEFYTDVNVYRGTASLNMKDASGKTLDVSMKNYESSPWRMRHWGDRVVVNFDQNGNFSSAIKEMAAYEAKGDGPVVKIVKRSEKLL